MEQKASSEDSEEEVTSPSEEMKPFGDDENKPEGGEDEEIVGRYFETLGTSSPGPKIEEQVSEPPPLDTERLMRTRLSISARFLSRSHQPGRYERTYSGHILIHKVFLFSVSQSVSQAGSYSASQSVGRSVSQSGRQAGRQASNCQSVSQSSNCLSVSQSSNCLSVFQLSLSLSINQSVIFVAYVALSFISNSVDSKSLFIISR